MRTWRWPILAKRAIEQFLLLDQMRGMGASSGTGRSRAANAGAWQAAKERHGAGHAQITPCAHVFRFLLHPDDIRAVSAIPQQRFNLGPRKWVKLFEPQDGNVVATEHRAF